MNRGRRLVAGHAKTPRRIAGHRPAEIASTSAVSNAFVNGLRQRSANEVDILTDLEQHDGDAAVLTDGNTLGSSDLVISNELLECLSSQGRRL